MSRRTQLRASASVRADRQSPATMPFPAPGLAEEADSVSGWWGLNIDESAMRLNVALAELAGKPLVQQDYCYKSRDECPERGILFRVFCCAEK